jgi:hypothetical protein
MTTTNIGVKYPNLIVIFCERTITKTADMTAGTTNTWPWCHHFPVSATTASAAPVDIKTAIAVNGMILFSPSTGLALRIIIEIRRLSAMDPIVI